METIIYSAFFGDPFFVTEDEINTEVAQLCKDWGIPLKKMYDEAISCLRSAKIADANNFYS